MRDVGVVDRRGGAGLLGEAVDESRIAGESLAKDFDGEIPVQRQVDGLVHRAHAADAERIEQKKVAELQRDDGYRLALGTLDVGEGSLTGEVNRRAALMAVNRFRYCARGIHCGGDGNTRQSI